MNVRWISTVDFKISTDISPMGVALEPPRLIISPLSWSSVMIGDRYVTCYWGVYNCCVVHFMMVPSTRVNRLLNCLGDILKYLKNCSGSFDSWSNILHVPEKERLRKIGRTQKLCFCFSFLCFCFFNLKSSKHTLFKNSSPVHNCFGNKPYSFCIYFI